MAPDETEEREKRGVFNPRVVDLISVDPDTGEVVLLMIEERDWSGGDTQLREVEAKLASSEPVAAGHGDG